VKLPDLSNITSLTNNKFDIFAIRTNYLLYIGIAAIIITIYVLIKG